jgi:hypothetical protein
MLISITQIALHAAHGTIKPLDDLFTEYTAKQNSLLVDSFLKVSIDVLKYLPSIHIINLHSH